jgi:5-methylcytosine-specific restriction endonuclease McrA
MKIHKDSKFKKAIIKRDGLKCKHCGLTNLDELTVDHIKPISLGGSPRLKNLQFLCKTCHVKKDKYVGQLGHGGRKKYKQKVTGRKLSR